MVQDTQSCLTTLRVTRRRAVSTALTSIALGTAGLSPVNASVRAQSATPRPSDGDVSGLVDIDAGRRIYRDIRGEGSPTVVFEAGYPNRGDVWDSIVLPPGTDQSAVFPAVAGFTRACIYDRPGTILGDPADPNQRSRSDPVSQPRTAADLVADLHDLLQVAQIPGPYVLVGHSLGGLVVRLFAATYPAEVAGLVLVDSSHEDQNARFRPLFPADQWAAFGNATLHPRGEEDYPDMERIDFDTSSAEMREAAAAHPLPPLPLVVLSHGRPFTDADVPPGVSAAALEREAQELQSTLAALLPGARQVIATESGHYIQLEQPELVIDAIRDVVESVRDPGSWESTS